MLSHRAVLTTATTLTLALALVAPAQAESARSTRRSEQTQSNTQSTEAKAAKSKARTQSHEARRQRPQPRAQASTPSATAGRGRSATASRGRSATASRGSRDHAPSVRARGTVTHHPRARHHRDGHRTSRSHYRPYRHGHRYGPRTYVSSYYSPYRYYGYSYPSRLHYYGPAYGLGFGLAGAHLSYNVVHHTSSGSHYGRDEEYGEIETDIKPSTATVYVDGIAVGVADDFNGWPGKLRIEPGRHDVVFREPGYRPLRFEVEVLPYHAVRIDRRMQRGPDDLADPVVEAPIRRSTETYEPFEPEDQAEPVDLGTGAELILELQPQDVSVYVDGELIGDGGSRGYLAIEVGPGPHRVEVVKPGYDEFRGEVVLRERQRQELTIRLQRSE